MPALLAAPLAVVVAFVLPLASARMAGAEELRQSQGQLAYVPVYSHIRHGNLDCRQNSQAFTSLGRAITTGDT